MTSRSLSFRSSVLVGLALLGLWALSWALSYAHLGPWSAAVALTIAAIKAILVALFFMELIAESPSFNFAIGAGVLLVGVLITLTVLDVATRAPEPNVEETMEP